MRALKWLLRAFLFFALFAFSLNNQQTVTVHWFFGYFWQTPLIFVVLVSLAAGMALGVLAMTPAWWRQRAQARRQQLVREAQLSTLQEAPQGVRDGL
ncbi:MULTISPECIES: lipopolysaccharide assembly protein LapA domain-containing protein [Inhella]|uniref:LapA family protein n=1 Tax=Inhella proteolytica TaxID=2795029 RepID=A0A931NG61_9BURK|nr:LapA family protein [Inhella proteolytica]MBH9576363.1 LapA family protein [Inhella proteolytica]